MKTSLIISKGRSDLFSMISHILYLDHSGVLYKALPYVTVICVDVFVPFSHCNLLMQEFYLTHHASEKRTLLGVERLKFLSLLYAEEPCDLG